jgi:hypothetical protein
MDFSKDAGHIQDGEIALSGSVLGNVEKRRFPDPSLAADDERRSASIDSVDQVIDQGDILLSALQHRQGRSGCARGLPMPCRACLFRALAHPTTAADAMSRLRSIVYILHLPDLGK